MNKLIVLAECGGFYERQRTTAIIIRKMEMDYTRRNDDGILRNIIDRAKTFAARMSYNTKANANNHRKFNEAVDDYVTATGLSIAM